MSKSYKYYDRSHRFDNGAIQAYKDGEKPLSKWTKKIMVAEFNKVIDKTPFFRITKIYHLTQDDVKQYIKKMSKEDLQKVLIKTDVHRTGNYYMNTKFYRTPNELEITSFIIQKIYKPKEYVQLKLDLFK